MVRLDPSELCLMHLDHALHRFTASECFRRGNCRLRLHEYTGQVRGVLLGEYAGELQDACSLSAPIDEDHDFPELSSALANPTGGSLASSPRRFLFAHTYS